MIEAFSPPHGPAAQAATDPLGQDLKHELGGDQLCPVGYQ